MAASSFWACLLQACKATSAHRVCTLEAEVSCPPGCSSQLQPHPTTSEPSGSSHQQPSPPNSDPSSSSQQQPLLWTACIRQLVVYGLGSMQSSLTSRYQLALVLLLMHELLPQLSGPPIVFDPAFSEADMALLKHLGMHLAEQDERCARRTAQPTFFYMPHVEVGGGRDATGAAGVNTPCKQQLRKIQETETTVLTVATPRTCDVNLRMHAGLHMQYSCQVCYLCPVQGHLCDNLLAANLASDPSSTILAEAQQPDLLPQVGGGLGCLNFPCIRPFVNLEKHSRALHLTPPRDPSYPLASLGS